MKNALALCLAGLCSGVCAGSLGAQTLLKPRALAETTTFANSTTSATLGLSDLVRLSLERHPVLSQAQFDIDAARGRALQAGLYPNPVVAVIGDEMSDKQGPGGIITAPQITQELVTADKLRLSQAAGLREADQATLALARQRYALLTAVRQGYFDALTAQRRVEIVEELLKLAEKSYESTRRLLEAKQVSKLDLLQLQVELNRFRAELDAARQEQTASLRRLAAGVGAPELQLARLSGKLDAPLPRYDFEQAQAVMLASHPERQSAEVGVTRAQLHLRRAEVEPIPNVTVGAGYVRQGQTQEQ